MDTITTLLAHPFVPRLGWSLVHFIWQAAVLAGLLGVALQLLRRRSPNSKYLACAGFMLLMAMAVPVTFCFVPGTSASIQHASPPVSAEIVAPARIETSASESAGVAEPAVWTGTPHLQAAAVPTRLAVRSSGPWHARILNRLDSVMPWAVLGWLAGVIILSARLVAGWVVVQRLKSRYVQPAAEEWTRAVERLRARLAVSRPVRVVRSSLAQVPSTLGWIRPVILLPASALTGLSREQLEAIIAHELAHIRRHDYLVNLLQSVVETLLFYHPAVWWVSHRMRVEREHCCDDLAVAACGNPVTYARALSDLESLRTAPALLAAATGGSLVHRVRRILGVTSPASDSLTRYAAGLLVAMVVVAFAVVVEISSTHAFADETSAALKPPTTAPTAEPAEMTDQPHRWRHFVRIVVGKDAMTFEGKLTNWDHIAEGYGGGVYGGAYGGDMGTPSAEEKKQTVVELARASDDVPADVFAQAETKASEFVRKTGYEYLSDIGVQPLGSTGGKSQFLPPLTQRGRWRHFLRVIARMGMVDGERAGLRGPTMAMGMGMGGMGTTDIIASIAKNLPEPQWTMVEVAVAPNMLDPESYAQFKSQLQNEAKQAGLEGVVDVGVQPVDTKASPSVFLPDPNQAGYWRHYVTLVVGPDRMTFQGESVTSEQLRGKLEAVPNKSDTVLCIAVTSEKMDEQKIRERINPALPGVGFNHISWVGVHPLGTKGGPSVFFPTADVKIEASQSSSSAVQEVLKPGLKYVLLDQYARDHLNSAEFVREWLQTQHGISTVLLERKQSYWLVGTTGFESAKDKSESEAYVKRIRSLSDACRKALTDAGLPVHDFRDPMLFLLDGQRAATGTRPASIQAAEGLGGKGIESRVVEDPDNPGGSRSDLKFPGNMFEEARNDKMAETFRPLLEGKPSLKFDTPKSKVSVTPARISTGRGESYQGKVLTLQKVLYVWATPAGKDDYHFYGPFPNPQISQEP